MEESRKKKREAKASDRQERYLQKAIIGVKIKRNELTSPSIKQKSLIVESEGEGSERELSSSKDINNDQSYFKLKKSRKTSK